MADDADKADGSMDVLVNAAIKLVSARPPEAKPTGFCLFCGDPVEAGRRWCSEDCYDDWELRRRKR